MSSQPGRGTTFRCLLPAASQQGGFVQTRVRRDLRLDARVLVVEDDPMVRRGLVQTLKHYGLTPLEVTSSEEALQILTTDASSVDVVLMDLIMPGLSGADLWEAMQTNGLHLPVVLSSGYPGRRFPAALKRAVDDGRVVFLAKPYSHKQLIESLEEALASDLSQDDDIRT